ncbi:MAG: riboflavin synthase [Candidatus Omnitrophota bacterium]
MFTGIIKEVGKVRVIRRKASLSNMTVSSPLVSKDANEGDSVAVNGVCLTVVNKKGKDISFDVVKTTLGNTNIKRLKIGSLVNLEPSLAIGDKLGGHFVLGHVDCEAKIKSVQPKGEFIAVAIDCPGCFRNLIVEKGSVAVEGISLTVQKLYPKFFTVSVIPYTFEHTNIKNKRTGDWVNVEFDYLLKGNTQLKMKN